MGILQVVYEDGHMACVVKPAGMPTAQVSSIHKSYYNLTCGAQSACMHTYMYTYIKYIHCISTRLVCQYKFCEAPFSFCQPALR